MKKYFLSLVVALLAFTSFGVQADANYPWTNPTYIPSAVSPAQTFSAPGTYTFTNNGVGTVALAITGTCTGLSARVQGTVDGTNWTILGIYPVAPGTASAASIVSATGVWRTNAAAFKQIRVNITALTASCTMSIVGTQAAFTNLF